MADWEPGDVIRVAAKLETATGEDIVNVFHYLFSGAPTNDEVAITAMRSAIATMYGTIQPAIPSDVAFSTLDFQNVTQGLVYGPRSWPGAASGGGTGDTMPEQCCALVVGTTNQPRTMGRKFLGPFVEAENLDGTWSTSLMNMVSLFAIDYLKDIIAGTGGSLSPVVVRYLGQLIDRVVPLITVTLTNGIYTQRRRRRGVGV